MFPCFDADIEIVKSVVHACYAGGASIIEFTNRGNRALDLFRELTIYRHQNCPKWFLAWFHRGSPTAALYIALGADFVVGPVLDQDVAKVCNAHKVPYCPGCGSVTEIRRAHLLGVEICKIFPGAQVGGPAFVKAVKGPCPWAELMPTGEVAPTRESLTEWFSAGMACAGAWGRN